MIKRLFFEDIVKAFPNKRRRSASLQHLKSKGYVKSYFAPGTSTYYSIKSAGVACLEKAALDNKNSKSAVFRANVALCISAGALLVSLLANLENVLNVPLIFLEWLQKLI